MARKVKYKLPDLTNATPAFLIDEIGKLAEASNHAKKLSKMYKEALTARLPDYRETEEFQGDTFKLRRNKYTMERLDNDKAKETLDRAGLLNEHLKVLEITSMRTTGVNEEWVLEDPNDPFRGLLEELEDKE